MIQSGRSKISKELEFNLWPGTRHHWTRRWGRWSLGWKGTCGKTGEGRGHHLRTEVTSLYPGIGGQGGHRGDWPGSDHPEPKDRTEELWARPWLQGAPRWCKSAPLPSSTSTLLVWGCFTPRWGVHAQWGCSHHGAGFTPLPKGKRCAMCHREGYERACYICMAAIQVRCDLNISWEIDSVDLYKPDSSEKYLGCCHRTCWLMGVEKGRREHGKGQPHFWNKPLGRGYICKGSKDASHRKGMDLPDDKVIFFPAWSKIHSSSKHDYSFQI